MAQAGKFMFVEYAKPIETVKGQKKRRGGPSEVRAVSATRSRQRRERERFRESAKTLSRKLFSRTFFFTEADSVFTQHITKNYHRALRVKRLESLTKGDV